jgi:hypothetical protein
MANERIYLLHRASGLNIMLGKRMLGGYYAPPSREDLQEFYEACEEWDDRLSYLDDFEVVLEADQRLGKRPPARNKE